MTPTIIGIGSVIILAASLLLFRRNRKHTERGPSLYMDALNSMLEEKHQEALEKLKLTVKADTENIMAYIYLGVVLRKLKLPVRASKVHKNLLVRNHLPSKQLNTILHHLILDYQEAGMADHAVEVAERLIQSNKHDLETKTLLLSLYEEKQDWDKAFFHRQSLNRWMKKKDQDILALYKVQAGLRQTGDSHEREGRIRFREAIKLYKKCVPAYLYWSDSYRREGRNNEALKILKEFLQAVPEWAHLGFDRLKTLLFDMGRYGDIEALFNLVIRKKPNRPDAYLELMDLYVRAGKYDKALDLAQKSLDLYPDNSRCRMALIRIYEQQNRTDEALEEAKKLIHKEHLKNIIFACSHCGFESSDPLWLCPQCRHWKTFLNEPS
ncbi:tetratricopeptide repeat protein [bacterium]|nr:tetratricopeptide repeat protein [bacterium]